MKVISTAVGIIHDGEWFLLVKKKGKWIGWQFIQGAQEKGETKEEAVLREAKEETGLDCIIERKLRSKRDYWFTVEGEKIHKLLTFFLLKTKKTGNVRVSEEHSTFAWCKKEEVPLLVKYNKDVAEQAIEKYIP